MDCNLKGPAASSLSPSPSSSSSSSSSSAAAAATSAAEAGRGASSVMAEEIKKVSTTPILHRKVNHVHKLERKHSSGDLHSRLKTRKLLGVGETDDGDVHRSKLSQILGHSEQLYVRLPRGLRIWQFITAIMFSFLAIWALILPKSLFRYAIQGDADDDAVVLPVRLYGAALLSFAVVFWSTIKSGDRDIIRWSLFASAIYFIIQIVVCFFSFLPAVPTVQGLVRLLFSVAYTTPTVYLHWSIGRHFPLHGHKTQDGWAK